MKIDFYAVLAWLYPNRCLICGDYIKAKECICSKCENIESLKRTYHIKFGRKTSFMECFSNYPYVEYYRWCMKRFKFYGKKSYARKFISFTLKSFKDFPFDKYDRICYVPMFEKDQKKRGYNQSQLLAKRLAKRLNLPLSDCLVKVKQNKVQHRLKASDRIENVKGVYQCNQELKGKNIILIDDIVTTGATLCQCAKMLYQQGASNVVCFAMASTMPPTEKGEKGERI